jgi:hypothetical protein
MLIVILTVVTLIAKGAVLISIESVQKRLTKND